MTTTLVHPLPLGRADGELPLGRVDGELPLGRAHVTSWRERGSVLVDGLLPDDLVAAVAEMAAAAFPVPADVDLAMPADFGSGGRFVFPSDAPAVNTLTLHPRLLGAVAQLLGTPVSDLRLTQSDLWVKYGRTARSGDPVDNDDQRMHVDYPNHTLTHPPPWDSPDAVEMIVYLSDARDCGGATRVVPRRGPDDPAYRWPIVDTPGVAGHEWVNDRGTAEAGLALRAPDVAAFRAEHLYAREEEVVFRQGTVLLYRHDTWHRGTPLHAGARRMVMNLTFRRAASEWISTLHEGWAWSMYRRTGAMERLIIESSVEQRAVLGFPPPGHPCWTAPLVDAVRARYPGIDLSEYVAPGQPAS